MARTSSTLAFGPFELDRDRFELRREGRLVRVEPRVLELLAHLAGRPGRLVTKDELVDSVWGGQFVSDAALSRAIHGARKALGESGTDPVYVQTVHGRGYRFAAPVAGVEGGEGAAPAEDAPEAARSSERSSRLPVLAGLLLVLAAAALLLLTARGRGRGGGEEARRGDAPARLAILPLSIRDPDSEARLVGLSFTDLLSTRLQRVPGLIVRPPGLAGDPSAANGSVAEYAAGVGAEYVLTGSLQPRRTSGQLDLTIEVLAFAGDASTRQIPLGRYSVPRLDAGTDLAAFLAVRDAVVDRVLELMGPAVGESPGTGVAPRDPEAYRLYLLAYRRLLENYCGGGAAEELVQRSLEIDPDFALAWDVLATAYYNRVWACGEDASLYRRAMEATDRAIALDPELPNPHYRKITLLIETGEVESAYTLIRERLRERPHSPQALNAQSYALRVAGFLRPSSAALEKLLEVDPLVFDIGALGGSPNTFLYQGKLDRFLQVLPASEMPYIRYYRGFAELLRDRVDAARAELEPAFRAGPGEVFGRLAYALLATVEGDGAAARRIVDSLARQRQRLGGADGEITYKEAQILALAGAREEAIERLSAAVDQGFFCAPCLIADPSLDSLRDAVEWEPVLEAARRRHRAFGRRFGLQPEA